MTDVPFREALRVWAKVGLLSFGGPAGQIALMHRIVVEEKRWLDEKRYLHALNYCMLLPGPEAQQLATYAGWLLHGARGAIAAGVLFVLPGFLAMLALSLLYVTGRDLPVVSGALQGLQPAVLAIVVAALVRIGTRALRGGAHVGLAAGAFVALFLFSVPFPAVVAAAAAFGFLAERLRPGTLVPGGAPPDRGAPPGAGRTIAVLALGLAIWFAPVLLCGVLLGRHSIFTEQGVFFSKAAVVTFGGAYAVLAYVAQQAVEVHGWLAPGEMLQGLGLAETTPGPLVLVLQFVGFVGAWREPAPFAPLAGALVASGIVAWTTFVPSMLWIFAGAPWVEWLRGRRTLDGALSAVTASVVGVILNLAVWFAAHVVFAEVGRKVAGPLSVLAPVPGSIDPTTAAVALLAMVAMLRYGVGMFPVLGGAAAIGAFRALL